MSDDFKLTAGAVAKMHAGDSGMDPVVQILSCKKVSNNNVEQKVDRYRWACSNLAAAYSRSLIISDGVNYIQAMLATQQNHLIESGSLEKNAVVQLRSYAMNEVQNRRIVICLDVDPRGFADDKIGTPTAIEQSSTANTAAAPAAAAAAPAASTSDGTTNAARQPAKPANNARQNSARNNGRGASGAQAPIYPIEGLSPYQNKWTIKARVTQKSDIRHWSNAKGEGKLFSVTLMDETGEIRATGFNEAVDNLYELLEENKVYFITKARVNIAKKQFNNVNNEYEIAFDNHSEVEPCLDADVPQVKYNFMQLGGLNDVEKDASVDVLAVVKDVGELGSITTKTARTVAKRELTLVDRSNFSCRLTLWGKSAESWAADNQPVVAFKAVKVGDFGGRSLSMVGSSSMTRDPDIPEAHDLRGWFDNGGNTTAFTAHSNSGGGGGGAGAFKESETRTISQIKDEQLGMGEGMDFFNLRATLIFIKTDPLSYPACPTDRCNKKVTMDAEDSWRCEKCEKSFEKPSYRYILSINVADWTGQLWMSTFNEEGAVIVGKTADEMNALKDDDEAGYKHQLQSRNLQTFDLACRAKADTYQDTTRVRYTVSRLRPVDWAASGKKLAAKISELWGIA